MIRVLALAVLLSGCSQPAQVAANAVDNVQDVATEAVSAVDEKAGEAAVVTTETTTPVVLAIREAIEVVTEPLPPPAVKDHGLDQAAVDLVVRWEVGSAKQYTAKYQGVICPGGSSGPTIGIGYDLGTQTAATIRLDWAQHPQVDDLATASGKVGPGACAAWKAAHRGIRITYAEAERVFTQETFPAYLRMAERAYRNGWQGITDAHRYGLGSNGYNRGFSMMGSRNAEKRHTRDVCVPGNDAPCTARDLVASCRIWKGTNLYDGLCGRRHAEAGFVVRVES